MTHRTFGEPEDLRQFIGMVLYNDHDRSMIRENKMRHTSNCHFWRVRLTGSEKIIRFYENKEYRPARIKHNAAATRVWLK